MHTFVVDEAFLACRLCLCVSLRTPAPTTGWCHHLYLWDAGGNVLWCSSEAGVIISVHKMQESGCCGAYRRLVTSYISIGCRSQCAAALIWGWCHHLWKYQNIVTLLPGQKSVPLMMWVVITVFIHVGACLLSAMSSSCKQPVICLGMQLYNLPC